MRMAADAAVRRTGCCSPPLRPLSLPLHSIQPGYTGQALSQQHQDANKSVVRGRSSNSGKQVTDEQGSGSREQAVVG